MQQAVRFRIRKASGTSFQVDIVPRAALPLSLRRLRVRVDEMALLGQSEICISKRLQLGEVDRMIACCRQHPPQCVVQPSPESPEAEQKAFREMREYLRQRERAGVGTLSSGLLVLVIPLAESEAHMRCLIVNATTTVGEIGAQLPSVTTVITSKRLKRSLPPPSSDREAADAQQSPVIKADPCAEPPPINSMAFNGSVSHQQRQHEQLPHHQQQQEQISTAQRKQRTSTIPSPSRRTVEDFILTDLSPTSRAARFAALRQQVAEFDSFHHRVLLEWSTKPSDIDSSRELNRQT
ncbi:hypothetical protein PINS_up004056 [Pythium insidiosum]|nr:hypothetical protein PINS_up004056 [Pythium insidiosum]